MYDPAELKEKYDKLAHGKQRIAGIRYAIEEADKHYDLAYQLFFRLDLCRESVFFDDSMDLFLVFPEALALVDKHPEIPTTPYNSFYKNGTEHMLWVYKWLVDERECYYQIPLKDCEHFAEDFKRRSLAYGFNLKQYYIYQYSFYQSIDKEYSEYCFREYEKLPRDMNADCAACERNIEINYYLKHGNIAKADQLSQDIKNFTLTCRNSMNAWLRMQSYYMDYYLRLGEFETAENYCRQIERNRNAYKEYDKWESFLYCYSHTNIGRALKIYKEHWKEWLSLRCPDDAFEANKYICVFFRKLGEVRKGTTVKLSLDRAFPLYREDDQYSIKMLDDFYYKRACGIAEKFDNRNGTDSYQKELEELLEKEKEWQRD